jgi:hypothetical protein
MVQLSDSVDEYFGSAPGSWAIPGQGMGDTGTPLTPSISISFPDPLVN